MAGQPGCLGLCQLRAQERRFFDERGAESGLRGSGKPGGHDGIPVPYQQQKLKKSELYDLVADVAEEVDVSSSHAKIVRRLEAEAERARQKLGDSLTGRTGKGQREPGRILATPAS